MKPAIGRSTFLHPSSVSRRIVINLVDQAERPAERIQYALVTLYIPAEKDGRLPAKFVSWNAFSTRSETVDYGTTKLKRDFSATANVKTGPIPSYEIGEAGGSATATRSMEEERKIVPRLHDAAPCRRRHQSTLFSSSPVKRPADVAWTTCQ